MKKNIKKTLVSLGTLSAMVAPVAAVVSCDKNQKMGHIMIIMV